MSSFFDVCLTFELNVPIPPLPANGFFLDDITTNRSNMGGDWSLASGDRLYVKQLAGAPGSGSVYFSVIYGSD